MQTSGSTMQYSPIRTPGPIAAPESTRAVAAMVAEGSIPDTFRDAAIAVLDAIILIEGGNCPQRLVVQALQTERLLQIFFKIVQRFQMIRSGRYSNALRRPEELLEAAVHQDADFATDQDSGAVIDLHRSMLISKVGRGFVTTDANCLALWRHCVAGGL